MSNFSRIKKEKLSILSTSRTSDWLILISIFLLINIILISWALYIKKQVWRGEVFMSSKAEVVENEFINKTKLSNTVNFFENKDKKFEILKNKIPINIDPSR